MTALIDLSRTKPITAITVPSFEELVSEIIAQFKVLDPAYSSLTELDPAILLLHALAMRELGTIQIINEQTRACMLAFSKGADLDELVKRENIERIEIDPGDPLAFPPIEPTYESDSELRRRALLAFIAPSTAGPRESYDAVALAADPNVLDIRSISPTPCNVEIVVLSRIDDGAPTQGILDAVDAAANDETVRPLGDRVTVLGATIIEFTIDVTIYVLPGVDSSIIEEQALANLQQFAEDQHRIGRDVYISKIHAVAHIYQDTDGDALSPNVDQVIVNSPMADVIADDYHATYCTSVSVTVEVSDG